MEETFSPLRLPEPICSRIVINPVTGCWEYQRSLWKGYARVSYKGKNWQVHRLAWTLLVGPIPSGLEIDHVYERGCRSTVCCNPAHLEPVTRAENLRRRRNRSTARSSSCSKGHALTPDNVKLRKGRGRVCVECARAKARAKSAKRTPEFYRERRRRRKEKTMEAQSADQGNAA